MSVLGFLRSECVAFVSSVVVIPFGFSFGSSLGVPASVPVDLSRPLVGFLGVPMVLTNSMLINFLKLSVVQNATTLFCSLCVDLRDFLVPEVFCDVWVGAPFSRISTEFYLGVK